MEAIFFKDDYFYVDDDRNLSESAELIFNGARSTSILNGNVFIRVTSEGGVKFIFCGEELGLFEFVDDMYLFSTNLTLNKMAYWLNKIKKSESDFKSDYKDYLKKFIEDNESQIEEEEYYKVKGLLSKLF